MNVADLEGAQLDYWVAKAEGREVEIIDQGENPTSPRFYARLKRTEAVWWPSSKWSQGGPIIERERIELLFHEQRREWFVPEWHGDSDGIEAKAIGPTPLIAAMRAYVASKFGDTIEDS